MISYQTGGIVVVGPHLLPGNFNDYFRKIPQNVIVENLNIIHIDIYSTKGMIETKVFMEKK